MNSINSIYKNILIMAFILVGVIGFYLRNQGMVGKTLLYNLLVYSGQSLAIAIVLIAAITFVWKHYVEKMNNPLHQ